MSATERGVAGGIEERAAEVRVRDLERKGVRRVRVLRAADIERLIGGVVAEALVSSGRQGEEVVRCSKALLARRLQEAQSLLAAADRAEAEIDRRREENAGLAAKVEEARARLARAEAALAEVEEAVRRLEEERRAGEARLAEAEREAAAAAERRDGLAAETGARPGAAG